MRILSVCTCDLIVLQGIPSSLVLGLSCLYRNLDGQVNLVPGFLSWSVFLQSDTISYVNIAHQTVKALHLLVTNMKDSQAITTLERKINLVTIKSISLSNLRDDWLVCCELLIYLLFSPITGSERGCKRGGRSHHQLCFQDGIDHPYISGNTGECEHPPRSNVSFFICQPSLENR